MILAANENVVIFIGRLKWQQIPAGRDESEATANDSSSDDGGGEAEEIEYERGLPRAKTIKRILMKHPDECTTKEKEDFMVFVELGLACIYNAFAKPRGRDEHWVPLTASDMSFALTVMEFSSAEAELQSHPEEVGGSEASVASSITEDKGPPKKKYKRRKLNTGDAKKRTVQYYYKTKKELRVWYDGGDETAKILKGWEAHLSKEDVIASRYSMEDVTPAVATNEKDNGWGECDLAPLAVDLDCLAGYNITGV